MSIKFNFGAYGILAIAALALILYAFTALAGRPDIANPLLMLAALIVFLFIIYMFFKAGLLGPRQDY